MTPIYIWDQLDTEGKQRALARPEQDGLEEVRASVFEVIEAVQKKGDSALRSFSLKFDKIDLKSFKVEKEEWEFAISSLNSKVKEAILFSAKNIEKFHSAQKEKNLVHLEILPGLNCWQEIRAIEKVGLYIPSGSAPLFSTLLMLGLPAKIAGCQKRIACIPPRMFHPQDQNSSFSLHPALLYAAQVAGVQEIYKVGGAQAIAAMAFGTESLPSVDKIFGPGNIYVTQAKLILSQNPKAAACDLPASASEQLCIADESSNLQFVASDLLSQAEHSPQAHVVLIAFNENQVKAIHKAMADQLKDLPRKEIIQQSLSQSASIVVSNIKTALEISHLYAPEHLILHIQNPEAALPKIQNAGSVFLGQWTPESLGDYSSGTNHVLPTSGFARAYSGLGLRDFCKTISFQKADSRALKKMGSYVEVMAQTENLEAHSRAVKIRLEALKKEMVGQKSPTQNSSSKKRGSLQ